MDVGKEEHTATASKMIERFRKAPPTSRAIREAMKVNGDAPIRMWYEKECRRESGTLQDERKFELETNEVKLQNQITNDWKETIDTNGATWRNRFRNGL